ncbi:hypothetical protein [Haloferax denitrificans]|nr:hypothetical protein [Haloferax denitrificans]
MNRVERLLVRRLLEAGRRLLSGVGSPVRGHHLFVRGVAIADAMGVMSKLRRLLGLVAGHEDEVAKQVGKRTKVSEEKAKKGIEKATDAVKNGSDSGSGDRSSY